MLVLVVRHHNTPEPWGLQLEVTLRALYVLDFSLLRLTKLLFQLFGIGVSPAVESVSVH